MKLLIIVLLIFPCIISAQNLKKTTAEKQSDIKSDTSTAWVAPKSADKEKNPLKGIIEAARKGENLFVQNCSECHGMAGKGDGPTADLLDTKPADLSSLKVQNQSDGALFWKISNGKGAMASYKEAFTKEQLWQLVNYIRKIGKENKVKKK